MSKSIIKEDSYQQKLKNVTNLRLLSFFLWKLIFIVFVYIFFTQLFSLDFLKGINWSFYLGFNPSEIAFGKNFLIKIFVISIALDWLKIIYYQKYEESLANSDYLFKLFFFPGYNTIFFFLNLILSTTFLSLFEFGFHIDHMKKKNTFVSK